MAQICTDSGESRNQVHRGSRVQEMAERTQTVGASISQDIFCQDCGYNLRGLTGERCPECGRSLEGLRSEVSKIPWVHRKEIGRFRAYWKTVWFVMFRQRQFCDEMVRPVSYSDSQRFRWLTVAIVATAIFFAGAAQFGSYKANSIHGDIWKYLWSHDWAILAAFVATVLWLAGITGVPSYFFHPKSVTVQQQNRALALSYYACGALSLVIIPILLSIPANLLPRKYEFLAVLSGILALTLPVAPLSIWWLDLLHLTRRLLPQFPSRVAVVAICVPCLQVLTGLLIVVVPIMIILLGLVLYRLLS